MTKFKLEKTILLTVILFISLINFSFAQNKPNKMSEADREAMMKDIEKALGVSDDESIQDLSENSFLSVKVGSSFEEVKNKFAEHENIKEDENYRGKILKVFNSKFLDIDGDFEFVFSKNENGGEEVLKEKSFTFEWTQSVQSVGSNITSYDIFKKFALRILKHVDGKCKTLTSKSFANSEELTTNAVKIFWKDGNIEHSVLIMNSSMFGFSQHGCTYYIKPAGK